jgi:5-methylcytosine-specific restriction protein A
VTQFIVGQLYSRKNVWNILRPNEEFQSFGNWATGYFEESGLLLAFANINTSGRTGHDFPNELDEHLRLMTWYGKPSAHSEQPTFKKLFDGNLALHMFVRWNNSFPYFVYLGVPVIHEYKDEFFVNDKITTIQLKLEFGQNNEAEHQTKNNITFTGREGKAKTAVSKTYERNPILRLECIKHHGTDCKICNFSFLSTYGSIGENFCHVHHLMPLSEVKQERSVDPIKDLIPVCPNCHAMMHRRVPPLTPLELKNILNTNLS